MNVFFAKHWKSILVFFLLQLFFGKLLAQRTEVGIAFIGDMGGERVKMHWGDSNFDFYGKPENKSYIYFGVEDSASVRRQLQSTTLLIKRKNGLRYKRVYLVIPAGFNKYLLLKRDHSQDKREYFSAEWSSQYPFELPKQDTSFQIFSKLDSAKVKSANDSSDTISVPGVSLLYDGKTLTAELLRSLSLKQNQIVPIQIEMRVPGMLIDSLPSLSVLPESIKVFFAENEMMAPYSTSVYKNPSVLFLMRWSFANPPKKGNLIGFIIHYDYRVNEKVVHSGETIKYIKF